MGGAKRHDGPLPGLWGAWSGWPLWIMAGERGDGGDASPAVEKSAGYVPPVITIFQYLFIDTCENFAFSNIYKIKWSKSEEKLNFGGKWDWVPMNPSPKQNFVATPLLWIRQCLGQLCFGGRPNSLSKKDVRPSNGQGVSQNYRNYDRSWYF